MASKEFKGKTCAYCRRERASEAKEVGGFNINVVHVVCERYGRARTYRRDGLGARFIILCLCGTAGRASRPAKDEETLQGKLAEMVASFDWPNPAMRRAGPPEYVTEALSLLMVVDPPISEQMIEAKEEVVKIPSSSARQMVPALCRRGERGEHHREASAGPRPITSVP